MLYLVLMVCVLLFFVFFFFKQKTAYELRISDWSSDVCSSDLAASPGLKPHGKSDTRGTAGGTGSVPIPPAAASVAGGRDRIHGAGRIPRRESAVQPAVLRRRRHSRQRLSVPPARLAAVARVSGLPGRAIRTLRPRAVVRRSEEHTSELQSLMRIS